MEILRKMKIDLDLLDIADQAKEQEVLPIWQLFPIITDSSKTDEAIAQIQAILGSNSQLTQKEYTGGDGRAIVYYEVIASEVAITNVKSSYLAYAQKVSNSDV